MYYYVNQVLTSRVIFYGSFVTDVCLIQYPMILECPKMDFISCTLNTWPVFTNFSPLLLGNVKLKFTDWNPCFIIISAIVRVSIKT